MKLNSKWLSPAALAVSLVCAVPVFADNDVDLPINGDFRGQPAGYCPASGWTLTPDGGYARILPTRDRDEYMLELRAAAERSQSVLSDLHQLPGNVLKLELKVRGSGTASAGYEAFDRTQRTLVAADRQTVGLAAHDQKIKRYFVLPPQAKYVRIRLKARAGSVAQFRDVDADVSVTVVPATAAPAPGMISAPQPAAPVPGMIAAPPPAASAPGAISAPAAMPTPVATAQPRPVAAAHRPASRYLQNDRYYFYRFLGSDEHFDVSLPVGSDVDFELGEDPDAGLYWRVVSYDRGICRVKLEHDRDGVFPLRRDKAEIELKALSPGKTDVVFACGGKKVTVHFTAQ